MKPDILDLAERLQREATLTRHRRLLVLSGPPEWARAAAAPLTALAPRRLWLGPTPPPDWPALTFNRAQQALGSEQDVAVLDLHVGLDPDALGAVAGTVCGGGLLVLLTPPLDDWTDDPSHERLAVSPFAPEDVAGRFVRRFVRVLRASRATVVGPDDVSTPDAEGARSLGDEAETAPRGAQNASGAHATAAVPARGGDARPTRGPRPTDDARLGPPSDAPAAHAADAPWRTDDQRRAVEAVLKVGQDRRRRRPAVLVSDRGRGKSTALGIAAARLLDERPRRVLLTAPGLRSVEPVFEHARRVLDVGGTGGRLEHGGGELVFIPPGDLVDLDPDADVVLIDEAAALPVPLLTRLLDRYPRVVFSTTTHGYEGTGRGFAVRFRAHLDREAPGWREVELSEPIRWAPDDPVERFVFDALVLDAAPADATAVADARPESVRFEAIDRDALDEATLRQLFGLLVTAHYRTNAGDLQRLMDAPNLSVSVLRHGEDVVAGALLAREGGFDAAMSEAIFAGRRRPRGHMLPETLACHAGLADAPRHVGARVVRIAVHPDVQARGLGGRLLGELLDRAESLDYFGSGFGATARLLRFWHANGFATVRIGVTRGKSSGERSAVVLKPLSEAGAGLLADARARFADELPAGLTDPLRPLSPELVLELMRGLPVEPPSEADRVDARACAHGARVVDVCLAPVRRVARALLPDAELPTEQRDLLVRKLLQAWSWEELVQASDASGPAQVQRAFRPALAALLSAGRAPPERSRP